jgi:hypothetical protein
MKKTGIVILTIGLLFMIFTSFGLLVNERVTDLNRFKIAQTKIHHRIWEPLLGAIVVIIGAGIYIAGRKGQVKTV